ncbi:SOUL family heme-binding protein [Proteiniclasticum ruminis]|uniref:SOUL heme-binding protein n=1 Tax=Proteiniclasticum ruminis TaxID=398199 RepID=A0A1I5CXW6_9CLOT|nr:heme-binding protein [Proteiniclasticum ruminis]SFN91799.1 SOUL heme-binding protein [Proteiniclasticum ruminis]
MGRYESPEYRVKEKEGAFEIREYQEYYVVKYKENEDPMNSGGFQTLFRYISKNNEKEAKISMTVPVIEKKEEEVYTMAFVLPKEHLHDIPLPKDKRLSIEKIEEGYYAAITFSGVSSGKVEKEQETRLKEWISKKGYEVSGETRVAYYNPPFIPGLFRRNEIWIPVRRSKE